MKNELNRFTHDRGQKLSTVFGRIPKEIKEKVESELKLRNLKWVDLIGAACVDFLVVCQQNNSTRPKTKKTRVA